jgi:glycosyltransferase involved in cell wall biosynthesis
MVELLIEGLGGDRRRSHPNSAIRHPQSGIECYHVNCRYSNTLEDIGSLRLEKMWLVLRYCLEAIWCRFRYGVRAFYYVPAPGKRAALYRDWVVMLLCRPFFREMIHHWHAAGLGDWLRREGTWIERWLTHRLLGKPALGIALAIPGMRDALWFRTDQVEIVANGIPDPCPDFVTSVLPGRRGRAAERRRVLAQAPGTGETTTFRVLYLAHCSREKGLMDTLDGVLTANEMLASRASPLRLHLTIAGAFVAADEEAEFRRRLGDTAGASQVEYMGFVAGTAKDTLLRECDALCFPTYYMAEGQPVNLIESLAFGLPCVTTRWRAIPDLLPSPLARFVAPRQPGEIANALVQLATESETEFAGLRERFLERTISRAVRGGAPSAIAAVGVVEGQLVITSSCSVVAARSRKTLDRSVGRRTSAQ